MSTKTKPFDAVAMKYEAQKKFQTRIRDLSPEEEVALYRQLEDAYLRIASSPPESE